MHVALGMWRGVSPVVSNWKWAALKVAQSCVLVWRDNFYRSLNSGGKVKDLTILKNKTSLEAFIFLP